MKQEKAKRAWFKSMYARFAFIFLGIWWLLNTITFSSIITILQSSNLDSELQYIQQLIGFVYLSSAFFGTAVILLAVRSVVRPIQELSKAAREIARGNLDTQVKGGGGDEIGRLANDFNTMAKEISSLDALRSTFVSNVSHEFRTPVTSIKGYAQLINEDEAAGQQTRTYSRRIIEGSDLLIGLSSNLLRLSELDTQVIHPQTTFWLDEQIRLVILLLQPLWETKKIELDIDLKKIKYTGDEELLRQVWLNLIQNAIKFTGDDGTVRIVLKKDADKVLVVINDNGVGMTQEEVPRIFDRFYKGEEFRVGKGNGLGLAIVRSILDQAGGTIFVQSEISKGTTVAVELPAKKQS